MYNIVCLLLDNPRFPLVVYLLYDIRIIMKSSSNGRNLLKIGKEFVDFSNNNIVHMQHLIHQNALLCY